MAQDGVNRQQQDVIDYLREENRVLRAGLRGKRLRLSDDDRRRLAVKAQALGREVLAKIASVATPATLLRWYRIPYSVADRFSIGIGLGAFGEETSFAAGGLFKFNNWILLRGSIAKNGSDTGYGTGVGIGF